MAIDISKIYDKTRDELAGYEDVEFSWLSRNVPNFYISRSDKTYWGGFLRSIAAELGRLEYQHSQDVLSKDPSYLQPPDVRREWNGPLFIDRNFPPPGSYDQDYKNLALNLIYAYRLGATVDSIQAVIQAYTGQTVNIVELYKYANTPPYDISYKNSLSIAVPILSVDNPNSQSYIDSINTITHSLYGAVDLAKPAHVGMYLGIVLGEDEDFHDKVLGKISSTNPIIDDVEVANSIDDPAHIPSPSIGQRIWGANAQNYFEYSASGWAPVVGVTLGSYIDVNGTLYSSNGTSWSQVYLANTLSRNESDSTYPAQPRHCKGLRLIVSNYDGGLPDPLYVAPRLNSTLPDTGLASMMAIIMITGSGFLTASPSVTYMDQSGKTTTAVTKVISDTQLEAFVPPYVLTSVVQMTVDGNTKTSGVDFTYAITFTPYPGILSPILHKAWEIKSDGLSIMNLD